MEKYLIICHISKISNVKQLVRIAASFHLTVVLVGCSRSREEVERLLVELGCAHHALFFDKLCQAKAFFAERAVPVYGIEILDNAHSVLDFAFPSSFALMPGNEGTGLNEKQKEIADGFVYIPQYGSGTASLNVHVATTVVLYKACLPAKS
eukprot:gene11339-12655_t